jgi:putrescine transport system permease protein
MESFFSDKTVLKALWISIRIALMSASFALILGTLTAISLVRIGKFKGRRILSAIATSPLVLPDVIMGLSLLLLFISLSQIIGWPSQRNMFTITIGHTTLAFAYVVVIVRSRLEEFDRHLEEAALDLGARPLKVFYQITLPLIAPSLFSGWLLAFTLSLDDIVLSSFLSGPGSSTLPMYIFSSVRFGLSPKINALATIMVLVVSFGVALAGYIIFKQQNKRFKKEKLILNN